MDVQESNQVIQSTSIRQAEEQAQGKIGKYMITMRDMSRTQVIGYYHTQTGVAYYPDGRICQGSKLTPVNA